ncbi:MAG TPA: efflux RND transporter periplasmic adaptor subunit [Stellaceae bacterium]|nr:efflux RND transporter periplasmic adaptor subunit [Stellaceae bacterium]
MTRWIASTLALAIVLSPVLARADDNPDASALVTLAKMKQGSLPLNVTAFGQIQPGDTAQESIPAPLAARVGTVKVRAGMEIKEGTPMVTLIPTAETAAAYKQAKLAARLASQLVDRDKSMVQAKLLTQAELLKAQNDEANAKSNLAVMEQEGAAGPNMLKAPFDAIVTKVDAGPGAVLQQGAPVVELAKPNGLVLEVGVVSAQAAQISQGDAVTITPLGSEQSLEGKVLSREAMIDSTTGLVPVQISFPLGKMLAGEMARAVIKAGAVKGYIVPHQAVLVDDDGTIFVVQAVDMAAKKVAIQVLASDGKQDVISGDDLDPKASVVLEGNHQLDDGTKLRLADASPKGANGK